MRADSGGGGGGGARGDVGVSIAESVERGGALKRGRYPAHISGGVRHVGRRHGLT